MTWCNSLKRLNVRQVRQVIHICRYSAPARTHTHAHARIVVHTVDLSHLSHIKQYQWVRFFPRMWKAGTLSPGIFPATNFLGIGLPDFTTEGKKHWND